MKKHTVEELVPKTKFDDLGIEMLNKLSDSEIEPVILPLLEWLQDMNWPVAKPVADVLAKHPKLTAPYIINLLSPDQTDDIWKYWIITDLLPLFGCQELLPIIPHIKRIASAPTLGEHTEEVDIRAEELLERISCK